MTLIVAMKSMGGIILAADSRGTIGDPRGLTAINDTYRKIDKIGNFGIGLGGASEMGNALLDELKKTPVHQVTDIDQAALQIAALCANRFNNWFGNIPPAQRPGVLLTLAGYRNSSSQAAEQMIYLMGSQANFAPQLFGHMPCMSGVPQYAVYLVHRYYDPNISLAKAKALAAYLISETASQDPKVGGPVRMAEITVNEGYRELTDKQVDAIHKENNELNAALRKFFLKGEVV